MRNGLILNPENWSVRTLPAIVLALTIACAGEDVYRPALPSDFQTPPPRVYRTVTIGDNYFNPNPLTVTVGTRVFWVNQGNDFHSVQFDPPISFFSGVLTRTEQAQRQFNNPGVYTYRCTMHEAMGGTIHVKP